MLFCCTLKVQSCSLHTSVKPILLLNVFLLCFSVCLQLYMEGRSQHSVSVHQPCLAINNHLLQRSCSPVPVCRAGFPFRFLYLWRWISSLSSLLVSVSPPSLTATAFIHLCSHVHGLFFSSAPARFCFRGHFCFLCWYFPFLSMSGLLGLRNKGGAALPLLCVLYGMIAALQEEGRESFWNLCVLSPWANRLSTNVKNEQLIPRSKLPLQTYSNTDF